MEVLSPGKSSECSDDTCDEYRVSSGMEVLATSLEESIVTSKAQVGLDWRGFSL